MLSVLTPNCFTDQDTWFLRITQPAFDAVANAPPSVRWERRKAPMNRPTPSRAGVNMVYRKFLLEFCPLSHNALKRAKITRLQGELSDSQSATP